MFFLKKGKMRGGGVSGAFCICCSGVSGESGVRGGGESGARGGGECCVL